jgi:flagellar biosynthesis anti-sigma factor FlgM
MKIAGGGLKSSNELPIIQLQGDNVERGAVMRIDLTPSSMPELNRSSSSSSVSDAGRDVSPGSVTNDSDQVNLSTGSEATQHLKSNLDGVPDVRQERVNSLKQAINNGTFQISPTRIAEGMLENVAA